MTKKDIHLVKRKGHKQRYDNKKVYASVYAACLACHYKDIKAEKIAGSVTKQIDKWIKDKKAVTSNQIFMTAIVYLAREDKDAAFMYETHMDIS